MPYYYGCIYDSLFKIQNTKLLLKDDIEKNRHTSQVKLKSIEINKSNDYKVFPIGKYPLNVIPKVTADSLIHGKLVESLTYDYWE